MSSFVGNAVLQTSKIRVKSNLTKSLKYTCENVDSLKYIFARFLLVRLCGLIKQPKILLLTHFANINDFLNVPLQSMNFFYLLSSPLRRRTIRNFSGQGRFRGIRALQLTFHQKHMKKIPRSENVWGFFSYNFNGKFNPKMATIRAFLCKIRAISSIFEKAQGRLPPP